MKDSTGLRAVPPAEGWGGVCVWGEGEEDGGTTEGIDLPTSWSIAKRLFLTHRLKTEPFAEMSDGARRR